MRLPDFFPSNTGLSTVHILNAATQPPHTHKCHIYTSQSVPQGNLLLKEAQVLSLKKANQCCKGLQGALGKSCRFRGVVLEELRKFSK